MSSFIFHITGLLFSAFMTTEASQSVMLDPINITRCPGDEVNLTCKVHAVHHRHVHLIWMSDEYIGTHGQQLEFWEHSKHGKEKRSQIDSNAVATLVIANDSVIESQFRIIVNTSSTIICKDGSSGSSSSSTIDMIGKSTSTLAGVCNCHSSSRNISFWI
jgi:hypothetical protein